MSKKVGIVFQKYDQKIFEKYPDIKDIKNEFLNIEAEFNVDTIDDVLWKLNRYWNSTKKLEKLLPLGFIHFLGTNLNETVSEVNEFQRHYGPGKLEKYKTNDGWEYYFKDSPSKLEINLCSTNTLDEIIKDCEDYEWDYVIYFDGNEFKCVKEN